MWQKYNPNPCGRAVGDCAVRAVAKALDIDWETAYLLIASAGFSMCDVITSNSVWTAVLRQHGFKCEVLDDYTTFGEFAEEHQDGVYVLGTGTHAATVVDGVLYDAWNSSGEVCSFVWYRKD